MGEIEFDGSSLVSRSWPSDNSKQDDDELCGDSNFTGRLPDDVHCDCDGS